MTLIIRDVEEMVNQITYRPGVSFWVDWQTSSTQEVLVFELHICEMVADSTTPEIQTQKHYVGSISLASSCSKTVAIDQIFRRFEEFEKHEASEWFRINGQRHKEPHS